MLRRLPPLVSRFAAAAVLAVAGVVAAPDPPSAEADPIVIPSPLQIIDQGRLLQCTELVPHAISLKQVPTTLDLRVLLDGVPRADAEEAVAAMRKAYTPLGITIEASYQRVSFDTRVASEINQAAKELYGGERPPGIDVVYTITSADLTGTGLLGGDVAGLAACIGGIRFPDKAFATGENLSDGPGSILGLPYPVPLTNAAGKTMAHEVGHLLGAHHHYFSPEGLLADRPNVGTLMAPVLGLTSLRFSTVNALMVRGHMEVYG